MFKFTRTGVNLISLSITIFIFILIQIFIYQYTNGVEMNVDIKQEIMSKQENVIVQKQEVMPDQKITTEEKTWQLEIEKISLVANISEGTDKETLNRYIGHFTETQKENGNIGLAGHNRGYDVNYFENLKLLQKEDEIKYIHGQYEKTYKVIKNIIIKDTDWTYLENTEDNRITLITCVENEPNYRRCVQAVEKEEEDNY